MSSVDVADAPAERVAVIPYKPRKHFYGLHRSQKRFRFVVAHRRAGKSVAELNELIKRALENERVFPPPRYAYVGPSFAQTKDLIWGYCKQYAGAIPGVEFSESDLRVTLPNGATITLYGGAAAYERMRGLYFDGIVLDEFPLLNPAVFSTVVRPCLADYRGFAIISGTSNGDDHFHELKKKNEGDDSWDIFIIPVTKTDALHPDEVIEMTKDMTPEEYGREMMCDFSAPIEGAYYGDLMNDAALEGRVCNVPHDPRFPVYIFTDLGIRDTMAVWFYQKAGMEHHMLHYLALTGKGLPQLKMEIDKVASERKFNMSTIVFPHDIKARELGTGRSRYEIATELWPDVFVVPQIARIEDGIEACRSTIPGTWFDEKHCSDGILALRNYQRGKGGKPLHNWASHGADGYRTFAMGIDMVVGFSGPAARGVGKLKRIIRGLA